MLLQAPLPWHCSPPHPPPLPHRPIPAALPCRYRLLSDATKAKENLDGLDLVGQLLGVAWAPVETPIEALAIAPPPPPLPPAVAAAEGLLEETGAGVEGMGGGIKLTGQVGGVDGGGEGRGRWPPSLPACLPALWSLVVCVQHMAPPCANHQPLLRAAAPLPGCRAARR